MVRDREKLMSQYDIAAAIAAYLAAGKRIHACPTRTLQGGSSRQRMV